MSMRSRIKCLILTNKVAVIVGILIGGVLTRFLEDGNLLVTSVLTGMTTTATLVSWLAIKKVAAILTR